MNSSEVPPATLVFYNTRNDFELEVIRLELAERLRELSLKHQVVCNILEERDTH